ncbi:MAG: hypothetical protein ABI839_04025 [Verrucomicrobiota bacterium]
MDPRPLIVHEGIPGHYFQLCLVWKNDDPIRVTTTIPVPTKASAFTRKE